MPRNHRPACVEYARDAAFNDTQYEYDAFGNLIEVTDPDLNSVTADYDIRGFKETMTDPDTGTWTYEHNAFGELTSQTDAKGQVVTFGYDRLGRVIWRQDPGGVPLATFTYGNPDNGFGFIDTVSLADGSYVQMNYYDSLSRPEEVITTQNGDTYTITAGPARMR